MLQRLLSIMFLIAPPVLAQDVGDPACDQLLLVSAFGANNVKIYNACDFSFVRNLDTNGYLQGPQAIAEDPDGNLVVVSEANGRLVRYHRDTLTYDRVLAGDRPETPAIEPTPVFNPTGLVITPGGRMFAGSFTGQSVTEVDPETGTALGQVVTLAGSGIQGPDTGMILDGNRLLVPGFDSSTVVEANIDVPGSDDVLVTAGAGGLNAPRTVLKLPGGNLLVTSWRSGQVIEFNGATGAFVRVVTTGIARPTGMAFESDEVILLASDMSDSVSRVRISDGAVLETVINLSDGQLDGPTFILVLDKRAPLLADNRAFWLLGVGTVADKAITVEDMIFTTGGAFGAAFDPAQVDEEPWGSLQIAFDSCTSGLMSWDATAPGFGSGGYQVVRLASDPFGDACLEAGFDLVDNDLWMAGLWYGGPARDGEGFSVSIINGGIALVTWYTYLPQ